MVASSRATSLSPAPTTISSAPIRTRRPRADLIILRRRRCVQRAASHQIISTLAPLTRVSKVKTKVLHDGACQLKSLNGCCSSVLHELSCGHLFCAECIVAHLKSNKKRSEYRFGRRKSVSEANLNMKQRKVACFLCRVPVQCGCSKRAETAPDVLAESIDRPGGNRGCYMRPPGGKCVHFRQRSNCKQCSKTCPHGKIKHFCKSCGGCAFCEHGNVKSCCRKCKALNKGGGSICEHDRIRSSCKDCGGSSICLHGKSKSKCRLCGGSALCSHGREKHFCKDCKGAGVCEHGTQSRTCKICKGGAWCTHNKLKAQCRECCGSVFCHHGKRWRVCRRVL